MKKYLLSMLSFLAFVNCQIASAQIPADMIEAFPDPIFREYVLNNFDTDGDGKISKAEALAVTEIKVIKSNDTPSKERIASLDGIQYFTNLIFLDCSYNELWSLDMSANTKLMELHCMRNKLISLNISKNTALIRLDCRFNRLEVLNISNNTQLRDLNCYSNQLTTLDVSKNTELRNLFCGSNQLTALDVRGCTELVYLSCGSNLLKSLDVSKNTELEILACGENQIEELDLSKTNIGNCRYNTEWDAVSPLNCDPMETLKKVYLKKGWSIKGVTEDNDRSSDCIPDHTEIIFVD